jgi:hypothetical protein
VVGGSWEADGPGFVGGGEGCTCVGLDEGTGELVVVVVVVVVVKKSA